jgi:sugar/nucleoside kinase (ribokinase family)
MLILRPNSKTGFTRAVGIGGIGAGIVYALRGAHDLGRNESRLGELLESRDYCKLHIVQHYIARLMGSSRDPASFRVWPVGVVGNDEVGRRILTEMNDAVMDTQFVRSHLALKTLFSVCFNYPDGSGGNITSSNSAAGALTADDLRAVSPYMKAAGAQGVALCLPEVPLEMRRSFLELASDCGNYRASSFALGEIQDARVMGLFSLTDLLALNQEEASALFGNGSDPVLDRELLAERAAKFTVTHPQLRVVVSLGPKGAYGFECGGSQFCPAPVLQPISTAGAGDALLAGVVCGLAAGLPFITRNEWGTSFSSRVLRTALDFGVLNASFSVTSPHTIHPDAALTNLFGFAESHGASISKSLRSLCRECEHVLAESILDS